MKLILSSLLFFWINLSYSQNTDMIPIIVDNNLTIYCEVANTPEKLSQGLMFRKNLSSTQGMLFIFPYENSWAFWMKNTFIPLDIIWLNEQREVVFIKAHAPPCTTNLHCKQYMPPPSIKARYVLEINAGLVKKHNIHIHEKLKF